MFSLLAKDTSGTINKETLVIIECNLLSQTSKLISLNVDDHLENIRSKLLKEDIINDESFFLKRYSEDKFAEVLRNQEQTTSLNDVIYKNGNNILYVRLYPDLKFFNRKCKLEYGCIKSTDEIKKVEKKAFTIKDCEMIETGTKQCIKKEISYNSSEDKMLKTSLFASGDANINKFVNLKLGISFEKSKSLNLNLKENVSHICADYGKMNLKLDEYLEPTPEFVDEIRRAITSKDPQKLVRITEVYGQFIPTSIILGGRVYYENVEVSAGRVTEDNKEISANVNVTGYANIKGSYAPKSSEKKSNRMNLKYTKIIGGSPPESLDNFNEKSWIKSLDEDFRAWDVIEYQDTISIFQPLPTELRAQVRELVGKKVLYSAYKGIEYLSNVNPLKVELMEAPSEILSIITNKDADCNIFATISEMEPKNKDELFTYSVLRQTNEVPSILVSHIQHNSMRQSYKLKIGWMVIGYPDCIYLDDYQLTNLKVKFEEQDKNSHETKKLLNYKYDPYSSKLPLLGVPVISKLNLQNDCLVIGHHFLYSNVDSNIEAYVYCYNIKEKQYVELPPFTFDVLAIRNFGQRFIDCGVTPLIRASYYYSSHYYYIPNHNCHYPKFISPIYDHNDAIGTIYLRQVDGLIQAKYPRCSKKCQTCKKPSVGTINCTIFDPRRAELFSIANDLTSWTTLVKKEKAIYHTMNLFNYDANHKCLIAED
ncbi:hypothetical protein GLOIN_2v1472953 [Rhizophagus irregularis DAOM 181602=DAOM 197198]|nr:hypothetical protein GLOIN_2v1472953 [Rhizophagus irregularis DAOM 181602=DAOM 197198]